MSIWAISDLHLCLGNKKKSMEVFGPPWKNYISRMEEHWRLNIKSSDLVLIAGDISWAMKIEDAKKDLEWIDKLPGKKLIIKGNHDYWWESYQKVQKNLPPSITALQNNAYLFEGVAIGGTRLWDSSEYNFDDFIELKENLYESKKLDSSQKELSDQIFERELHRLKLSLSQMDEAATYRIAMTHYPPISAELLPSKASKIFEEYKINVSIFGHLHSLFPNKKMFGESNNINYILTSSDFIHFNPIRIL